MAEPGRRLRAATRGSALARWQTDHVPGLLGADVDVVVVETTGDRRTDVAIHEMGGQGVFVKEVQAAVLDGRADFAVHSAKDLPSSTPSGLALACVPRRADARDALVGGRFESLGPGARIGTGSVRRRAPPAGRRPGPGARTGRGSGRGGAQRGGRGPALPFAGLGGNRDPRLSRAGEFAAIVVAAAAMERLGRMSEVSEVLPTGVMIPQVGQGALAVE